MVYHGYLMSEALAYPVFLCRRRRDRVRGVDKPVAFAVPLVCVFAVATRVQFLVLPLAYLAAVAVCGRGDYRRHLVPAALTALLVAALVLIPGALGQYGEATHVGHAPGAVAHWALTTGYSAAVLVWASRSSPARSSVSALLWPAAVRSSSRLSLHGRFPRPGSGDRRGRGGPPARALRLLRHAAALRRLLRVCGAGRTVAAPYVLVTAVGALGLSLVSFPGLTGTAAFFFDSVTLTGFARVAYYTGLPNASLLYALAPLALGVASPWRVRRAPHVVAGIAIVLALATGAGVYATDRLATSFSARNFRRRPPDWLDRSKPRPGDVPRPAAVGLLHRHEPGELEPQCPPRRRARNPNRPDPFPSTVARVTRDGHLHLGAAGSRTVVVNIAGSSISLNGRVVARPLPGLVAYRLVPGTTRVKLARKRACFRPLDRYHLALPRMADSAWALRIDACDPVWHRSEARSHRRAHADRRRGQSATALPSQPTADHSN